MHAFVLDKYNIMHHAGRLVDAKRLIVRLQDALWVLLLLLSSSAYSCACMGADMCTPAAAFHIQACGRSAPWSLHTLHGLVAAKDCDAILLAVCRVLYDSILAHAPPAAALAGPHALEAVPLRVTDVGDYVALVCRHLLPPCFVAAGTTSFHKSCGTFSMT